MEVYGDIYLLLNALCDMIVLSGCGLILKKPPKKKRLFLAGLAGGLFSLLSLYLYTYRLLTFLLAFPVSLLMILLCFGYRNLRSFALLCLAFYLCSFFFSGAVQFFTSLLEMHLSPFVSSLVLILTLFSGLFLLLLFFGIGKNAEKKVVVTFTYSGKIYTLTGFSDSGNLLSDKQSGLPVVVVSRTLFDSVPEDLREIKVSTIAADCILQLLPPDNFSVNGIPRSALLGLCVTKSRFAGCQALVPSSLV